MLKPTGPPAVSLMARWLDLDQDGDLDLYVVNYCAADHADKAFLDSGDPPPGLANAVYRNDGQPDPASGETRSSPDTGRHSLRQATRLEGLDTGSHAMARGQRARGGAKAHTGIALLDIDNDRDLDLVLTAEKAPPVAMLNDRLGQFHEVAIQVTCRPSEQVSGILATDFDSDGRTDLVAACSNGRVLAWRNITERTTAEAHQTDLRVLADQRRQLASTRRPSTSTSTACPTCSDFRPPRTSPAKCSCRPGHATKGIASRKRRCP